MTMGLGIDQGDLDFDDGFGSVCDLDATFEADQISIGKPMRRRVTLAQRINTLKRGGGRTYFRLLYYGYQEGSSMQRLGKLQDRRTKATSVQIGTLRLVGNEYRVTITHRLNRSSRMPLERLDKPYENGTINDRFFRGVYLSAMQSLGFFAKPRAKPYHYAAIQYVATTS